MIGQLIRLADFLDQQGQAEAADVLDRILCLFAANSEKRLVDLTAEEFGRTSAEKRKKITSSSQKSMVGYVACRIDDIFTDLEEAGWKRIKIADACRNVLRS